VDALQVTVYCILPYPPSSYFAHNAEVPPTKKIKKEKKRKQQADFDFSEAAEEEVSNASFCIVTLRFRNLKISFVLLSHSIALHTPRGILL